MPIQQLMLGSTPSEEAKYIDDVFNIYAYRGNGSSQSITNNINMSSKGGMIWVKNRSSNQNHWLFSSAMGLGNGMRTNSNGASFGLGGNGMSSYNNNGFTVGGSAGVNNNAENHISWTFRNSKAFQTLTYEGTGINQNISHDLGSIPGMIIVKNIDVAGDNYIVLHRSLGSGTPSSKYLYFNGTNMVLDTSIVEFWNNTNPTATQFTVGVNDHVNRDGETYVAYIFAGVESTAATAVSVDFDGNGDDLRWANHADFEMGTGDFTLECWIKPSNWDSTYMTVFCVGSGSNTGGLWLGKNQSNFVVRAYSVADYIQTTDFPPLGQWTHVAASRSGSTLRLFYNGILQKSVSNSYDFQGGDDIWAANDAYSNRFVGNISNLRLVKGTAVYTASFRPPTEPLTNITNTKLLCCNNSSTTGSTVTPGTITANGDPTASPDSPFDDPAGFAFGENEDTNIFKMGSYIGNGSAAGPKVFLGWEPQYVLIKRTDTAETWNAYDSIRGISTPGNDQELYVQSSSLEYTYNRLKLNSTGFQPMTDNDKTNDDGGTYIYFCVRRSDGVGGKPAEAGTETMTVVNSDADTNGPCYVTNFVVDFLMRRKPTGGNDDGSGGLNANMIAYHRLMGDQYLKATNDDASSTSSRARWWFNTGANHTDVTDHVGWLWKRHAGFDVIAYTGTGVYHDLPHSLGKKPEMVWVKRRDADSTPWVVSHKGLNQGTNYMHYYMKLNETEAQTDGSGQGNKKFNTSSDHTSTHIAIGNDSSWSNASGAEYICLAFASVEGVSKLGYYQSDNGTEVIDLGFQARFLIVKRTDSTGNWKVFDSLRGMNVGGSGLDAALNINDTSDQTDDTNWFYFSGTGNTTINMKDNLADTNDSTNKYIYYAHA